MEPEILHGGVATRGAVVRVGGEVLRPSGPQTPAVHARFRRRREWVTTNRQRFLDLLG